MNENPIRHDYTRESNDIGWGIIDFDFHAPRMARIKAFGLKREIPHKSIEESYLLPGEEVVISMPDGNVLYEISHIRYYRDPYDMYEAELNYVQHLTGMRIVAQLDEKQRARSIEWGQRKRQQQ